MITQEDVKGVADFVGKRLTDEQLNEVVKRYDSEQDDDPSAEWYLVVEKIIYDIAND